MYQEYPGPSPVWSLFLVKDIVHLEKVLRKVSQLALGQQRGEMPSKTVVKPCVGCC